MIIDYQKMGKVDSFCVYRLIKQDLVNLSKLISEEKKELEDLKKRQQRK